MMPVEGGNYRTKTVESARAEIVDRSGRGHFDDSKQNRMFLSNLVGATHPDGPLAMSSAHVRFTHMAKSSTLHVMQGALTSAGHGSNGTMLPT